jgi:hypothetical protein
MSEAAQEKASQMKNLLVMSATQQRIAVLAVLSFLALC